MAHTPNDQETLSFTVFTAEVEDLRAKSTVADTELEAQRAETEVSQRILKGLSDVAQGERAALSRLCEDQARIMNPLFRSGQVPLDVMIEQAFIIAGGIRPTGYERLQDERAAVERVLPQLQTAGTRYAVFNNDSLAFHTAQGPAYLRTGHEICIEVPTDRTKYHDTWSASPINIEVEPGAIIERYKIYQADILEDLGGERIEYGGKRYQSEQGPIRCARTGRVMKQQEFAQKDEAVQTLVQAAQGPLRQYFEDMMPRLLAGFFGADASDTRQFLYAVDEAMYLNVDKVQEVIDALVGAAANAKLDRIDDMVALLAVIIEHKNGIPDNRTVLDSIERRAKATLEAIALVKVA